MKITILSLFFSMSLFAAFTQKQLDKTMEQIDNLCMDTYCGGDFNYYNPYLTFDTTTNLYTLNFKAEDWYDGDILGKAIEMKLIFPISSAFNSTWQEFLVEESNRVTINNVYLGESYWEEKTPTPVVSFSCQFELKNNNLAYDDFFKQMEEINLDCVDAFVDHFVRKYLY